MAPVKQMVCIPVEEFSRILFSLQDAKRIREDLDNNPDSKDYRHSHSYVAGYCGSAVSGALEDLSKYIK